MTTTRRGSAAAAGTNTATAIVLAVTSKQEQANGQRRKSARLAGSAADMGMIPDKQRKKDHSDAAPAVGSVANKSGKRVRDDDGKLDSKAEEDAPKKSRGRPRKSAAGAGQAAKDESAPPTAAVPVLSQSDPQPELEPPKKRSRKSGRLVKAGAAVTDVAVVAVTSSTPEAAKMASGAAEARLPGSPSSTADRAEAPPATAQTATAVPQAEPLAVAEHQLQPQCGPVLAGKAVVPQAPAALIQASVPALATAPASPGAVPRSPQQRDRLLLSPQKRVLGAANAMTTTVVPSTRAPTAAAASPRAALSPHQAPGADCPKVNVTAVAVEPAIPRPDGVLTDMEVTQIRRLLMPGALAGTLASCAAAMAAADGPTTGPAVADLGGAGNDHAGGAIVAEPAGRTAQFKELYSMVTECCSTGRGCSVYISGLPGTGKTYTVSRLLAALPGLASSSSSSSGAGVSFCCATLNCMSLDDPAQLYGRLQSELARAATADTAKVQFGQQANVSDTPTHTDATAAHESLLATLSKLSVIQPPPASAATAGKGTKGSSAKGTRGTKRGRSGAADAAAPSGNAGSGSGSPQRRVFVVVLDEVDRLMRRRDGGEELVRLFQLPSTPGLSVVLLAVANSLDLTERMMPLLRARGMAPRHLVFTAYSRPQVMAILSSQLGAHPRGRRCFDDAALDMVAKSVSSSSGDLRQALKACRTALDVLLEHNRANPTTGRASVGIREVHAALQRLSSQGNGQPAVVAKIKGLPPQQQLVLLALATAVGAKAAAVGADSSGATPGAGFQPGNSVFTGSRPKFADAVAFREIGNSQGVANNPGACYDGPTPSKVSRPGGGAAPNATPSASRVRGVTGPGGAATPASCGRGPPSRTPASILAGDAGLALGLPDVYVQYLGLCRQLDIPAMSESAFRTDALPGLDCDGLLRITEGRTPAATRLSLRAMVRDVQSALADNVMFKRLMGAKPPPVAVAPSAAVRV